jgi:peptidoglycan/xylan/chitin deacetylase (PgdA/CDA1 family)
MSATPGIAKNSAAESMGRIVKLGVSLVYHGLRSAWHILCRALGKRRSGTAVVLYYHNVPSLYRSQFEEQMKLVCRLARPVALNDLNHLPAGSHSVAITFDDGLESVAENAAPVLDRLGVSATVFVVADRLGAVPEWGKAYYAPHERVMSEEQLRGLPKLISVGSHTLTHPDLTAVSDERAAKEIAGSRQKLEALLDRPVLHFAFPYGSFNPATVHRCRAAGYERVFTTEPALAPTGAKEFVVGRVATDPWDWRLEFRIKMLGAYSWLPYVTAAKRKIRQFFSPTRQAPEGSNPAERGDSSTNEDRVVKPVFNLTAFEKSKR